MTEATTATAGAEGAIGPNVVDDSGGDGPDGSLHLLNDRPVELAEADLLGLDAYAGALEHLIAGNITATPFTVAVHAPWGAGKSSLARLLQARLERHERNGRPHLVCWFNAWDHLVAAEPRGALVAAVARTASGGRTWWRRMLRPLPSRLSDPAARRRRRTWYAVSVVVLVGAAAGLAAWAASGAAKDGLSLATILATTLAGLAAMKAVADGLFPVWSSLSGFVEDAPEVAASGSLGEVKVRLRKLVGSATRASGQYPARRLVVIVDDLDRCPADLALSLSSACAQLLSVEGLVVVLLGDLGALEAQASLQFGALPDRGVDPEVGRRYVEKILQYRVDLPQPRDDQIRVLSSPEQLKPASKPESRPKRRRGVASPLSTFVALDTGVLARYVVLGVPFIALIALAEVDGDRFLLWVVAGGVALVGLASLLAARTARARGRFDEPVRHAIAAQISLGVRDSDAIAAVVWDGLEQSGQRLWAETAIAREAAIAVAREYAKAILHSFLERAQVFADDESNNPRQYKRLVNQMILAFLIADRRGLLAEPTEQVTEQVAKWSVLGTRWPELREQIRRMPDAFRAEEVLVRDPSRPFPPCDAALVRFLRSGPPLGPVVHDLLTMSRSSSVVPEPATTVAPVAAPA